MHEWNYDREPFYISLPFQWWESLACPFSNQNNWLDQCLGRYLKRAQPALDECIDKVRNQDFLALTEGVFYYGKILIIWTCNNH